jgi:RNA polymerase sigma-70 factor (ECF subfamily)
VTQETLRCVLEAIQAGRLQDLNALPGFVFQTARNICLKRIRGSTRRKRAMDRLSSGAEEAGDRDPLLELIDRERQTQVRRALSKLGTDDRDLLSVLYVEGVSLEEAGRRLGVKDGAVRVRKHRALRRLGRILGEDRYGEIADPVTGGPMRELCR